MGADCRTGRFSADARLIFVGMWRKRPAITHARFLFGASDEGVLRLQPALLGARRHNRRS